MDSGKLMYFLLERGFLIRICLSIITFQVHLKNILSAMVVYIDISFIELGNFHIISV